MIENDILPTLPTEGVQTVAIHCDLQARYPGGHVQQFGLSFPMALDYDSEQFRRFRIPNHVFPLNVVIDAEGRIAHIGTVLDDAVKAVEDLL